VEAENHVNDFLARKKNENAVIIITGRGKHSENNIPILKPFVEGMLKKRALKYKVISEGGAYFVYFK